MREGREEPELRTRPHPPGHANGQQLAYLTAAAWHTQQARTFAQKWQRLREKEATVAGHAERTNLMADLRTTDARRREHDKSAKHFRRMAAKAARSDTNGTAPPARSTPPQRPERPADVTGGAPEDSGPQNAGKPIPPLSWDERTKPAYKD